MKNLECSSRGDKRFSAFYAKVTIRGVTDSIENWYQSCKRDEHGKIPGKGKRVACMLNPYTNHLLTADSLTAFYSSLWIKYFTNNPELLEYAKGFDTFTDMFRGKCVNCQADVIAECVKDFDGFKKRIMQSDFYEDCFTKKSFKKENK